MAERSDTNLFLDLVMASQHAYLLAAEEIRAAGTSPRLAGLIVHIGIREPVTPGDLAEELGITATTMRDQLQELVDAGEIERQPNPADGRSYFVALTPQGRARTQLVERAFERARGRLGQRLGVEETERVLKELVIGLRGGAISQ
jgi:DNA-binding MarR family transcriptional regulator